MTTTSDPSAGHGPVRGPELDTKLDTKLDAELDTEPGAAPATDPPLDPPRTGLWPALRPLLLRLHFYAGVLVAPFVVVACVTGLAYLFSPQLSDALYAEQLVVAPSGTPRPLDDQVAAALAAHPEGALSSVVVAAEPDRATQVVLTVPELTDDRQLTVYVDPYTGDVTGALVTWFGGPPAQTLLDDLHTGRILGETGRLYSELAASWLPVLVLGGLALWVGRRRRRRAALVVPPVGLRPGRSRILGWHGVTGLWLAAALVFIGITGMTWSTHAGERFTALVTALDGRTPQLAADPGPVPAGAVQVGPGAALAAGRDAGLVAPITVTVPEGPGAPYTVAETSGSWPVQRDKVAVDPYTATVVETIRWADFPVTAKLTTIGILGHMGTLFGLPNQLALLAMGLGLLSVVFWGYRMWWQRRPTRGTGRRLTEAAPRGTLRALPLPALYAVVLVAAVFCWAAPVFGVSLLAFLAFDVLRGVLARRRAVTGGRR